MMHMSSVVKKVLAVGSMLATSFSAFADEPKTYDELVAAAKAEGALVIGDSTSPAAFAPVIEAFTKSYPFLQVEQFTAGGEDAAGRLRQEIQANVGATIDVFGSAGSAVLEMIEDGQLLGTDWAAIGLQQDLVRSPYQVKGSAVLIVFGYNTNMVSAEEAPKSWDDLLAPKWHQKVVVALSGWATLAADLATVWGEDRVEEFTRSIAAQAITVSSAPEVGPRVGSGEVPVGVMRLHHAEAQINRGAPVAFKVPDPTPSATVDWQIPVNASHPNAARLFIHWVSSLEGQLVYEASVGRGNPLIKGTKTADLLKGVNLASYDESSKEALAKRAALEERYFRIIQPN